MSAIERPIKVFLAHSSQDKPAVWDVYHLLQIDGFSPWLDKANLVAGQNWELEIKRAVQTSDAVAVFLSKNSVDRAGYLHKEITLALDYAQRQPEGEIFIVPIRLEECEIPDRLRNLHWIELPETGFSVGQAYLRLQRSLVARAVRFGQFPPEELIQPWFESMMYSKMIPDSYPVGSLEGWYLVRGDNPDGSRYYGFARLTKDEHGYELKEQIGTHAVKYRGGFLQANLIFEGEDYKVSFKVNSNDGILLGEWGAGGVEELIPASPFLELREAGDVGA